MVFADGVGEDKEMVSSRIERMRERYGPLGICV